MALPRRRTRRLPGRPAHSLPLGRYRGVDRRPYRPHVSLPGGTIAVEPSSWLIRGGVIVAWVEKTQKDRGHAWCVGYRGPDRRQRYKTFIRKADADLFAATVETDMSRGDWTDPRLGRITVAEEALD